MGDTINKTIGKYRILEEIGRGGMGVVYKGLQISLSRVVALKMLPPQFALSREFLERFQREARILARLAHKNIVHIYDLEELEGAYFIIMEFVDGQSLSEIIASKAPISMGFAKKVAIGVISALSAAHHAGIIHRDIKPENIMIDKYGEVKVMDFGVARVADESFKTRVGIRLGTPEYMSPEQAKGLAVDAQSDIYSLGIVLYEMITAHVPFTGEDSIAIALKHLHEPVVPLSELNPDLSPDFERIILKALEKEKTARFATADEFCLALQKLNVPEEEEIKIEKPLAFQYCPECGFSLKKDFLRCPGCGLVVRRICPYCKESFDAVYTVCPHCSRELPALIPEEVPKTVVEAVELQEKEPSAAKEIIKQIPSAFSKILGRSRILVATAGVIGVVIAGILIVSLIQKKTEKQTPPIATAGVTGESASATPSDKVTENVQEPPKIITQEPESGQLEEMISLAKDYFNRGAYDYCIVQMEEVLKWDPENQGAKDLIERSKQVKPMVEEYLKNARTAFQNRNYQESVRMCELIRTISPLHPQASELLNLAQAQISSPDLHLEPAQKRLRAEQTVTEDVLNEDRKKIQGVIYRQKLAMETENIALLLQDVIPGLHNEVRRDAEEFFSQNEVIKVDFKNIDIQIKNEKAEVRLDSFITFSAAGSSQQRTQTLKVSWYLEKRGGIWKIAEF